MRLFFFILLLTSTNACWFSSKKGAIKSITKYMHKIGRDPEKGLDRNDFEDIIKDIPGSIRWAVKKLGNIDGVFDRCDADGDGKIKVSEAKESKRCIASCWKSLAIESFL